nr:hypothetical protein [Paraburkholderia sp. BL6665CI2N2]
MTIVRIGSIEEGDPSSDRTGWNGQQDQDAGIDRHPDRFLPALNQKRAQLLLHGSGLGLDVIAAEVDYVHGATLRTLLRSASHGESAIFEPTYADGACVVRRGIWP